MNTHAQKPETLPAETKVGPFRLIKPLNASGGMATLYLAEVRERYSSANPLPGWSYAVFWMTDTVKTGGLRNEHLCFMAMEYIDGISLRKYVEQRGRLTGAIALGIARQLAEAGLGARPCASPCQRQRTAA